MYNVTANGIERRSARWWVRAYERYQCKNTCNRYSPGASSRLVIIYAAGTVSWFYGWVFLMLCYSFGIVLWPLRHYYALNVISSKGGSSDESQFQG